MQWLCKKEIGFTNDQSLWPSKKHADTILDKINTCYTGFTEVIDPISKEIRPRGIKQAMYRRFHYNNECRKDEFGIPRKFLHYGKRYETTEWLF